MRTGRQAVDFSGLPLSLACWHDASITENYF